MNIPIHEMDPRHARVEFLDYRKRVAMNREIRKQRLTEAATKGRQTPWSTHAYLRRGRDC